MAATEQALEVNRQHMPFELDGGVAPRAAIGLIVLATDNTIEHEFRQIVPRVDGAAVFHTRILNDPDINPRTLRAMESGSPTAAARCGRASGSTSSPTAARRRRW